ncbi:MAG TPA: hypothetical protein ENG30_01785, partial [Thermofilaceae archaeon]|nr:hypothetical protein [Thermofilaceae archaeon]
MNRRSLCVAVISAIMGVGALVSALYHPITGKSVPIEPPPLTVGNRLIDEGVLRATSGPRGLSNVKVAILYESVTYYKPFNRTIRDVVRVIEETGADFVFRCFWRWNPCPETPEQLPPGKLRERCEYVGYYYQHLKQVISTIKASMPD